MTAITFSVVGRPVPWARAGTNKGRHYTPPAQAAHMKALAWAAKAAGAKPQAGAVDLEAAFILEPPASWSKKAKAAALVGLVRPTSAPDASNYTKILEDALNGIAWLDDAQVVSLRVSKSYGPQALTVVTVRRA